MKKINWIIIFVTACTIAHSMTTALYYVHLENCIAQNSWSMITDKYVELISTSIVHCTIVCYSFLFILFGALCSPYCSSYWCELWILSLYSVRFVWWVQYKIQCNRINYYRTLVGDLFATSIPFWFFFFFVAMKYFFCLLFLKKKNKQNKNGALDVSVGCN